MSATLYRKYRPQTFADVVSQEHIKITLQNEISAGKLAHAYLFCGPRGIGKTTMARLLAKAVNCHNLNGFEPCGECSSCLEIADGRSMDLVEIDAASSRGINDIKELREQAKYTPVKEKYKVFIIDEAHMLTTPAFNALLKIMEEPPQHVLFVLATTEIHKIPETIISRCQRFDYKKIPFLELKNHLLKICASEEIKVADEVLDNIARLSGGYLRDSLSLLGQILTLGEKEITASQAELVLPRSDVARAVKLISLLLSGKTGEALQAVSSLIDDGLDPDYFLKFLTEIFRQIMLAKVNNDWQALIYEVGPEYYKEITQEKWASISAERLIKIIDCCFEAVESSKRALIPQLPLEICLVKISKLLQEANGKVEEVVIKPKDKDDDHKPSASVDNNDSKDEPIETEYIPIKEEIIEPEKPVKQTSNKNIDFAVVLEKWPEVIEALKSHNFSLAAFLQVGQPARLEGNNLILGFQYSFHFERIKERANAEVILNVLEVIFDTKLTFSGEINDSYGKNFAKVETKNVEAENNMVKAVLDTLGGEVVPAD
jgi:DNA polymerase-3 subunit gamma/tau